MSKVQTLGRCILLGVSLALAATSASAAPLHVRAIVVDAAPLAASGVPSLAEAIRRAMVPAMADAFAGLVVPGDSNAPVLRLSLDSITYAGAGSSGRSHRNQPIDYLHGTATLAGPRGEVLLVHPMLAANHVAGPVNANFGLDLTLRTQQLAQFYAAWLRKEIGG